MEKRILFVGHDANRAGAQVLLLRFLTLLKSRTTVSFTILLRHGGELLPEFKALADVFIWYSANTPAKSLKKVQQLLRLTTSHNQPLESLFKQQFDLIVANTIANGDILPQLKVQFGCPIYTYVHEMEMHIRMYTTPEHLQSVFDCSDSYITCGESVKENLIENHQILAEKISVLPSLLPQQALDYQTDIAISNQIKELLNIEKNAFVVGGMGTIDWRKGVDIFVQIAAHFAHQSVCFLWVGGSHNTFEYQLLALDCQRLGISNIRFVEAVSNPLDYMAVFDVLLLSSREEGYPLVLMEAGLLQKPMIAFEKAGGAKDFIGNDAGILVPYLDTQAATQQIQLLKENKVLTKRLGENAYKKVLAKHHTEVAFKKFVEILGIET